MTAYLQKDHGNYQLTTWNGETMLSARCEVVKAFWCGALAVMFRLPKRRFIVGYALGDDGMLFRGELINDCDEEEARSLAWAVSDHLAELDVEGEQTFCR